MREMPIANPAGGQLISRYGRWAGRLLCLAWLMSAAGCFEKTYADRMQVSVKYYDHVDTLNRNLAGDWSESNFKLRVPQGFEFLPKPVPPEPEPGKPPTPPEQIEDTRQPSYLGITLPGLVAAWQKTVQVDEPNGPANRNAYIYLLSNTTQFGLPPESPGRIDPAKFDEYTVNHLAEGLGIQFKKEDWQREDYPNGFNLVPKVSYNALVMLPDRQFEGAKTSFKVYITSQGEIFTILLFVYPDTISGNEKLNERIPLCLETLRMPANAAAAAPTGTPAASGAPSL